MKKYTKINLKWFLWGIVLPICLFLLSYDLTYAILTSSAKSYDSSVTTGQIQLNLKDVNYTSPITASITTSISEITPDTFISLTGQVANVNDYDLYLILEFQVKTTNETIKQAFYTFNGTNQTEITLGSENAYLLSKQTGSTPTINFSINYNVDFFDIDNTFQGRSIFVVVTAYGIQTQNITATEATQILIQKATA